MEETISTANTNTKGAEDKDNKRNKYPNYKSEIL